MYLLVLYCLILLTARENVFIPNYYVRFGTHRTKPLGIAYADLHSVEEANVVIKELDGTVFKDRKLRVRQHIPYNPPSRLLRLGGSLRSVSINLNPESAQVPPEPTTSDEALPVVEEGNVVPVTSSLSKELKYSDTTLFIKGLNHKATEGRLKEFFDEFKPTNIKILKSRRIIRGFTPRPHNALVSFTPLENWSLDHIIESCKSRVFDGYSLALGKAFASRDTTGDVQGPNVEPNAEVMQGDEAAAPVEQKNSTEEKTPVEPEAAPELEASKK